jgi:hypothetical protein
MTLAVTVGHMSDVMSFAFEDVSDELARQRVLWGVQDHPSFYPEAEAFIGDPELLARAHGIVSESAARDILESAVARGQCAWAGILIEEVAELFGTEGDLSALREELIQVAAVALSWVDCLDRGSDLVG